MASPYARSNMPMDPRHSSRLSLRQRFYLLEVLVGLGVTAHHFFTNMWRHTPHTVFRVKSSRGAVTIQYPDERRPYAPRLRSLHRLVRREGGPPPCGACISSETVCPPPSIHSIAAQH